MSDSAVFFYPCVLTIIALIGLASGLLWSRYKRRESESERRQEQVKPIEPLNWNLTVWLVTKDGVEDRSVVPFQDEAEGMDALSKLGEAYAKHETIVLSGLRTKLCIDTTSYTSVLGALRRVVR